MKKKIYFFPFILIFAVVLLTAFGGDGGNSDYPSGAPAGYTGSPGDGQNCTSCHNGSASTQAGIITSNIPGTGYVPGSSYTITVTLSGSGQKGFEVSPQNASGTLLGTLTAGAGNKLVGSGKYCTHSSAVGGSSATWNFTWTAPAQGTGTVTFYGAFTITKPVTKLSTLVVNEGVLPLGVTASATPSTILSGSTSQLNATATGGSGIYTYSWVSNPAGYTSTQQNPTVSPTVTTIYTVTVNDGSGSANGNTIVTVIPNNLAVIANASPPSITSGQSSQLTSSASGGSGTYTYSWTSIPAGYNSTQQNPVVYPTVTTQYIVQANDGYQVSSANTTVTVTAGPLSCTASATPGTICSGNSSQLNVLASGGSGIYTYSWTSFPAGFTSTFQNPVVYPTASTQYIVQVNDGTNNTSDNTQVDVTNPPAASAGTDTTYCVTITEITLHGTATGSASVLWTTSGDGTFSNASGLNSSYFPGANDKSNHLVHLTLTASPQSPCTNAATSVRNITFIDCPVGVHDPVNAFTFFIRPNPSNGMFAIYSSTAKAGEMVVKVMDLNGKIIVTENISVTITPVNYRMDLSGLGKGLYFVRIETNDGVRTEKLIIE